MELERCRSGAWKASTDFDQAREALQEFDPEVDTERFVAAEVEGVRVTLTSSGVIRAITEDPEEAEKVLERVLGGQDL